MRRDTGVEQPHQATTQPHLSWGKIVEADDGYDSWVELRRTLSLGVWMVVRGVLRPGKVGTARG